MLKKKLGDLVKRPPLRLPSNVVSQSSASMSTEEEEEAATEPIPHWKILGSGTFGMVMGVGTQSQKRVAAIKFIFASHAEDQEEAHDEAMLHHLLFQCHAPSFGPLFGCFWHKPDLQSSSIPNELKQVLETSDSTKGTSWLRRLSRETALISVMELGMHGTLHALAPKLSDLAGRQIGFQLAWSLSVGQMKLGNEHRDLSSRNVVAVPLAYTESDHITLYQRYTGWPMPSLPGQESNDSDSDSEGDLMDIHNPDPLYWILRLSEADGTGYIPRIIDFGFGTYADPRVEGRGETLPHHEFVGLAHHTPPESYFGRKQWCDWRVDLWQLGIVLFTCFGQRFNLGLKGTHADLIDEMGRLNEPMSTKVNDLQDRFVKEALLDHAVLGDLMSVERVDEWIEHVSDPEKDRARRYHRYLMIACLQEHLGNDWRPPQRGPESDLYENVFARTLGHKKVATWFDTHIRRANASPYSSARYYVSRLDADQRSLLKSLMAWDPAKRIHGFELLKHPVFAQFSSTTFFGVDTTDLPPDTVVRQVLYECHERIPLVAGKTHMEKRHAELIRNSQHHFTQQVEARGMARNLQQVEEQVSRILSSQPLALVS